MRSDCPFRCIVIRGERSGPRLLITGGVHGDEFEPMVAIRRLASLLEPQTLKGTLTLVPVVNEPAFHARQRCGLDGLDLARICPGRPDGSVSEQTAWHLSEWIRASDFYIDLHTGGTALMLLPLVGYMLHPERRILAEQRRMARAFELPLIWGTSAALDGRSLSIARDAQVPAIYAECGGGGRCNPEGVAAYVKGCLNVMLALGMIDALPDRDGLNVTPREICPRVIEDGREGSGHLQAQHPSPASGYFDCEITLGQTVQVGQRIGRVVNADGSKAEEVRASTSGLVICLRTFPAVCERDTLAVIIEEKSFPPGGTTE